MRCAANENKAQKLYAQQLRKRRRRRWRWVGVSKSKVTIGSARSFLQMHCIYF